MTKYLVLYRSKLTAADQMTQNTPEQAQAGMEAWMAWASRAGDAIVDLGSPTSVVDAGGDTGDPVGGYSILQADSHDELQKVLQGHPHFETGGTIETLELLSIPGM
jgi:YCII-related domain